MTSGSPWAPVGSRPPQQEALLLEGVAREAGQGEGGQAAQDHQKPV